MSESDSISLSVPEHLAIIMDGNRRWADQNGKTTDEGHRAGYSRFKEIVDYAFAKGVKYVTVYAFSTENWKRSEGEVSGIMALARFVADNELTKYAGRKTRVRIIGRHQDLPADILKKVEKVESDTDANTENNLNVAFSYGGRAEIVDAVNAIVSAGEKITEAGISEHLYTAGQPDPELIIRTGGSPRLSNFLMWQSAYSEIFLTDTLWPDFSTTELEQAFEQLRSIKRNFGR